MSSSISFALLATEALKSAKAALCPMVDGTFTLRGQIQNPWYTPSNSHASVEGGS